MLLRIGSSNGIRASSDGASGTLCPPTHTSLLQGGSVITTQIIIAWVDFYHIIGYAIGFNLALCSHCFLILNHSFISPDEGHVL